MSSPSILIIGAGCFGTSTAYHLSRSHPNPSKITILDRSPFPPHHAASTDINKIVRADYTSVFYMKLAYEALDAWKTWPDLQDEQGRRFFHPSGWVCLSEEGSDVAERIRRNFKVVRGEADPSEDLDVGKKKLRERWAQLLKETKLEEMREGYWNPEAGWADAAAAVKMMLKAAVSRGVRYVCGNVDELLVGEQSVKGVKTKDGKNYEADKVLLATGAWTSQLLSSTENALGIKYDGRIERQVNAACVCVVHYKLDDEEYERFKDMPVLVYGDKGEMIPPPLESRLLKFTNAKSLTNNMTTSSNHYITAPPDRDQTFVSANLKQETIASIVETTLPEFASRPVDYWRLCWDSITPTQDQLITKHPDPRLQNLYLAVGGSFHSWKFLPIIGRFIANVLSDVSNGEERDSKWAWKSGAFEGRGAHEGVVPRRELNDVEFMSS